MKLRATLSIAVLLFLVNCFIIQPIKILTNSTDLPTCDNIVLASNTSTKVIKSLSMYQNQAVLLYGEANDTTSVFLRQFKLQLNVTNDTMQPLYNLQLDHAEVIKQGPLVNLFPGLEKYTQRYEIVSMLYYADHLVLFFFRKTDNKTIFVVHNTTTVIHLHIDTVKMSSPAKSFLLLHMNNQESQLQQARTTYFMGFGEVSCQVGQLTFSSNNQIQLSASISWLMYINNEYHNKLFLLSDRSQVHKFKVGILEPLGAHLSAHHWRALQFNQYIYILSGHKSGTVLYFNSNMLQESFSKTELTQRVIKMNYARFFGCQGDQGPVPGVAIEPVEISPNIVKSNFIYFLLGLGSVIVLLCVVICCCYSPMKKARKVVKWHLTQYRQSFMIKHKPMAKNKSSSGTASNCTKKRNKSGRNSSSQSSSCKISSKSSNSSLALKTITKSKSDSIKHESNEK